MPLMGSEYHASTQSLESCRCGTISCLVIVYFSFLSLSFLSIFFILTKFSISFHDSFDVFDIHRYDGSFSLGVPEGEGVLNDNGDVYSGFFHNGTRHGPRGTLTLA